MNGNSKAVPFHGILAMGNTKDEAVNRYRLLALGKGVSAMKDGGGNFAFVTHASNKIAEMFNPQTGELDLAKDEAILNSLEFEAQAGEVVANHYVCESGCGLHLVYDSESLVKHCPSCTTAIASDDDEEESEEDESEEETDDDLEDEDSEDEEEDEDFESESGDEEDEEDEEDGEEDDIDAEEDDAEDEEDEDEDDEDSDDEEDEEEDDEEDDEDDEEEEDDSAEPLVIAADSKDAAIEIYRQNRQGIATANTTVEVEYVVCSSEECNAHILSEDPTLAACPACQSDVKQPEQAAPVAQASDEDEEDSEEDSDLEVIPDDEEDEDEEETSESNSQPTTETNMNVENVTVDMLTQLNDTAEDAHKGLDVSFSGSVAGKPMWTAFYNGTPVAIASQADAGKNADIFSDVAFGQAVIAGARHVGVKATLAEMGFKGIAHEISLNAVVTDRVNAQVAEAKAGLDRDRTEHAERLMAALATAAIGINRGFFQETSNPVKAALWNAMSSAGVKNAEVLIDNAFRTSNDDYHRSLFAKASEIIGQPLEVQESLSKAVLGTNYMNAATASAGNPAAAFEDRLELGRSTATASEKEEAQPPKQESLSGNEGERISRAIAGLGRRRS